MTEGICKGVLDLLKFTISVYNNLTGTAAGILAQDPAAWNGEGWNFITRVNSLFLGIGAVLTVIFFLIGFCADSIDIKQDFRLENILRMLIKLSVAEFFVVKSLTIVRALFGLGTGIIGQLQGGGTVSYSIPTEVETILTAPGEHEITSVSGFFSALLLFITAIVFLLLVAGGGMMILMEAYQRFLKILLLVPYGTLANSTLAGNHMLSHSAESFWKYALCTIMEAVTMYLALRLSASVVGSGSIGLTGGQTGTMYVLGWMLESTFVCLLTLGIIKGAQNITQRALGL